MRSLFALVPVIVVIVVVVVVAVAVVEVMASLLLLVALEPTIHASFRPLWSLSPSLSLSLVLLLLLLLRYLRPLPPNDAPNPSVWRLPRLLQ